MPAETVRTDLGITKVGAPLHDAAQDPAAQVAGYLAVIADLPKRLNPAHADYATALAAWSTGLTSLADEVGEIDAEGYVALALAELPVGADEDDYGALVQQIVDATSGIDVAMATELRAIADVLDPP
jgi:hypothetical protein